MPDIEGMRVLIIGTLSAIIKDTTASASARTAAARTLAEVLGILKQAPKATSVSAIEELTENELDALIAARGAPVLPAPEPALAAPAMPVAGKRPKRAKRAKAGSIVGQSRPGIGK